MVLACHRLVVAAAHHGDAPRRLAAAPMSWARLLKRVMEIGIAQCPQCGGTLTMIIGIEDPLVTTKILTHLG